LQKNRHHREAAAVRFWKLVAVRIWKVVASGGWWQPECHQNATITVAGLIVLISVAPGRYHTLPPPWFIFCFCGKATDATTKETTIKHVLWGSCGSRFAEAGGSQCYGWVSVRKLVVSGGWWRWKCHHSGHCCQVGFIFYFCCKATDATATMVLVRCFLRNTTATVTEWLFFFCTQKHVGCGGLVVWIVFLARQEATTKNHGHCCTLPLY